VTTYQYLAIRAPSPCDGLDDMLVLVPIDKDFWAVKAQLEAAYKTVQEALPAYLRLESCYCPEVLAVEESEWGRVLAAINKTTPDVEPIEELYELDVWTLVEFEEKPTFEEARTEAWSVFVSDRGLMFQFYSKYEDRSRRVDHLNEDSMDSRIPRPSAV